MMKREYIDDFLELSLKEHVHGTRYCFVEMGLAVFIHGVECDSVLDGSFFSLLTSLPPSTLIMIVILRIFPPMKG